MTIPASLTLGLDPEARDVLTALARAIANLTGMLSSPTITGDGSGEALAPIEEEAPPDNLRHLPSQAQVADWERELMDAVSEPIGPAVTLDEALAAVGDTEVEKAQLTKRVRELEGQLLMTAAANGEALERRRVEFDQLEADLAEAQSIAEQTEAREAEALQARVEDARQLGRLVEVEAESDRRGRTIDRQAARIGDLEARIAALEVKLDEALTATQPVDELIGKLEDLESERDTLKARLRDSEQVVAQQRDVITGQGGKIEEALARVERISGDNLKLESERDTLKTQNERQAVLIAQQRETLKNLAEERAQ